MEKYCTISIVIIVLALVSATKTHAASPTEIATAVQGTPHAVDLAGEVARVPFVAAEVLYVPLGAGEIVLSPLPGPNISSGLSNVARGVLAPFKVGVAALKLPFHAIEKVGRMGKSPATTRRVHRAAQ